MNANDPAAEPLRVTMQLNPQQYQEGIFCWKAFLYYKWRLRDVLPASSAQVMGQIEAAKPKGTVDNDTKAYLVSAKKNIHKAVTLSCRKVTETLSVYDDAYEAMTGRGDPLRFRDFLLQAPALFNELGERLGAIDHIISFWRFRFPEDRRSNLVTPEELSDIFSDFEQSLDVSSSRMAAWGSNCHRRARRPIYLRSSPRKRQYCPAENERQWALNWKVWRAPLSGMRRKIIYFNRWERTAPYFAGFQARPSLPTRSTRSPIDRFMSIRCRPHMALMSWPFITSPGMVSVRGSRGLALTWTDR